MLAARGVQGFFFFVRVFGPEPDEIAWSVLLMGVSRFRGVGFLFFVLVFGPEPDEIDWSVLLMGVGFFK